MAGVKWKIQGEEKEKFETIFDNLGPSGGKLSGDKVKPVLMNSNLPIDVLGQVWELSDIDRDGFLDREEFCVAMHLVYKALEKEPVPKDLPTDVIPPSKRKPTGLVGAVPVLPPLPTIPGGPSPSKVATPVLPIPTADLLVNPMLKPSTPSAPAQKSLVSRGIIPEAEYSRFSAIFLQEAGGVDNYIAGTAARVIFMQSGLPQPVLAHVWNLCDQQKLGKLTQDQFVLAMYFISQKVKGVEVPTQLPQDLLPPQSRDSGFGDSGNISDSGSSGVGDFSAVRELDALNREIEELRREKDTLTAEIREKDQIVRNRNNDVQELQNTLDRHSTSLSQLESDKSESHTRLDELDQQQLKLDGMLADIRNKVQEETRTIASLHSQIKSQEMAITQREEEFSRVKTKLDGLKKEETQLQQTLEIGQQQLQNITKQVTDVQAEIEKVQEQIKTSAEQQKTVSSNIVQYDKAVTALKSETESSSVLVPETAPVTTTENLFQNKGSDIFDDPFKQSDPFTSDNAFKSDPFADTAGFNMAGASNLPSSSDKDIFGNSDPFAEKHDPFASESKPFDSTGFASDPFAGSDPFASTPTVTNSVTGQTDFFKTSEAEKPVKNSADLFKSDFFDQDSSVSLFNDMDNTVSKTSKTPDDPWAAFGASGTTENSGNAEDLFGKDKFVLDSSPMNDPFGEKPPSKNKKDKQSMKDLKNMSEEAQLAWAAKQSRKAEEERKEKLRIQEELDLEYAIKLSKES